MLFKLEILKAAVSVNLIEYEVFVHPCYVCSRYELMSYELISSYLVNSEFTHTNEIAQGFISHNVIFVSVLCQAAIRKELNEFKSSEMEVHEESRIYTRSVSQHHGSLTPRGPREQCCVHIFHKFWKGFHTLLQGQGFPSFSGRDPQKNHI